MYNISIIEFDLDYITVSTTNNITSQNLLLYLNSIPFTDFHLQDLTNNKYNIIPYTSFKMNDFLTISLIFNETIYQNLSLCFAIYCIPSCDELIPYITSFSKNGTYKINLSKINDSDCLKNLTFNITVCNQLNTTISNISCINIDKDNLTADIEMSLIDIFNNVAPNGDYLVNIDISTLT